MRRAAAWLAVLAALEARADVVVLEDGGRLEGRVSETETGVQVTFPNGGSAFVPRERVSRIERAPSVVERFQERRKALAPDDVPGRLDLAEWAAAQGLDRPVRNLVREVLALDPGNARAHALLGEVPAGGTFLPPDEAARRGYAPLARGWGEWDQRYAEDALAIPEEVRVRSRQLVERALGPDAEAARAAEAELAGLRLPARSWSLAVHLRASRPAAAPPTGRIEGLGEGVLAWVPPGHDGTREIPCLVVLGEDRDRWQQAAEAHGAALLAPPAGSPPWSALDALRARGVAVDLNRLVLAGGWGGSDAAWALLAREAERFSAAVLVSGSDAQTPCEDVLNAADLSVLLLLGLGDDPELNRLLRDRTEALNAGGGHAARREHPGESRALDPRALADAVGEVLSCRRVPWPARLRRRVRAGDVRAWLRVDELEPGAATASVEARVGPRNTVFLAAPGVRRLTLLLSDDLVDLSRPLTVTLNGRQVLQDAVAGDLRGMLERHRRDGDRHRVVTATLPLEAPR